MKSRFFCSRLSAAFPGESPRLCSPPANGSAAPFAAMAPMKIGSCSADLPHLREVCGFGAIRRRKTADRRKRGLRYMIFIGCGAATRHEKLLRESSFGRGGWRSQTGWVVASKPPPTPGSSGPSPSQDSQEGFWLLFSFSPHTSRPNGVGHSAGKYFLTEAHWLLCFSERFGGDSSPERFRQRMNIAHTRIKELAVRRIHMGFDGLANRLRVLPPQG